MSSQKPTSMKTYFSPLVAGACAGLAVDVALYPLDTLKTRLQSRQGFYKAGGFKGVYRGLLALASTSMPTSALFFVSYEVTKNITQPLVSSECLPLTHMFAAGVGEVLACLIRVPTEVVKQRRQTQVGQGGLQILMQAFHVEGVFRGVYRGFISTVLRDLPFSAIQMPLWELFKRMLRDRSNGQLSSLQGAVCGAAAGMVAAAATTPLDVAKTRIMLARAHAPAAELRVLPVLAGVWAERGARGVFAGLAPRSAVFMLGGFVFFGIYDNCHMYLNNYLR